MRCSMLLRQRLLKLLRVLLKVGLNFLDYIESTVLVGLQVRWILFFSQSRLTSTDAHAYFDRSKRVDRLEVNAYFGRSKTTPLKSLVTMIGKDRDLDDANYTKETRR